MKKKNQRPKRFENIVVFPGMTERLIEQGQHYAENYQYDLAIQCIEEALQFVEDDESILSIYAYALYETKAFEKAKEVCERLLSIGPTLYFEVMELYLTICMQLRDYEQAKTLIAALLEEEAVPPEYIEKFERLMHLNTEIVDHLHSQNDVQNNNIDYAVYELSTFKEASYQKQTMLLNELAHTNVRLIKDELVAIAEEDSIHPLIQSMALILLVEQEVDATMTVHKFGTMQTVNSATLLLPTELPQYQCVHAILQEKLSKDPTTLEMVEYLIAKHTIVSYPFEWLSYDVEDVADSYIDYVQAMFGKIKEMDYEMIEFIQTLDTLSEFQQI